MPKTSTTDQDTIEAEVDEVVAAWERAEAENKRARARDVVERRRFEQGLSDRVADIGYWEKRLARQGCRPVLAAWPTIPVPRCSAGPYAPTERMTALRQPRPVVYDAGFYRLDEQGIHMRQTGYWICSPVFQTARGIDETRPDVYAVEVDGTWRTVTIDPRLSAREPGGSITALSAAGLRLNPRPVHFNGAGNAVAACRNQDHYTFTAQERLAVFLADHARELPIRP
jgi:hypothetical protein